LAIVAALRDPSNADDRWIPDAATAAAAKNSDHFLRALAATQEPSEKLLGIATIVAEHYARGGPADSVGGVIAGLADAHPRAADAVVRGLARGWPTGSAPKLDERIEHDLERVLNRLPPERRGQLIGLATAWGSKKFEKYAAEVVSSLLAQVKNEALAAAERVAAARELIGHRTTDQETVRTILSLVTPRSTPEVASGLLGALQVSEAPATAQLILERLPELTPSARAASLGVLLSRPVWTRTLLEQVDQGRLQLTELSLDQRQALAEHPDMAIRRRAQGLLQRGGALANPDRQKELETLLPITQLKGDPAAGKVVFTNQCAKCHVHGSEGQRIGPDLTGMAVHPKEELLLQIIDPSRNVEGNFRVNVVETRKGQLLSGLLASESRTSIELFDAEGKKHTILREDIERILASNKSLMPDGFEKQVSPKELTDLLEFLTQRGKYLPLPLDKVATAISTRGMFNSPDARAERLVFDDWKPKTVADIPFHLIDPQGDRMPNVILLYGPQGRFPPAMPKAVSLPCNTPAKAIHLLSGVSGWGHPYGEKGSVSLIVRLHYGDGKTEDHPLRNGEHFADYIRRVEVPGSQFAFNLRGQQLRYLAVHPARKETIKQIELVKGPDDSAPIIMAVTIETLE
jgi:putative heme-binding domain-containing protein